MKNIHYILLLAMCALSTTQLSAQSIADAWTNMPAHISPSVIKSNRLDMIDLYNAGMKACVRTFAGDTAQLITLGNTYLNLRTSKASTLQIKQIQTGKKLIYVVITTIEGPVPNSHIDIYDAQWQPSTKPQRYTPLVVEDFISLPKKEKNRRKELLKSITLHTIQYTMSEEDNNITATPSFLQTLDEETRNNIQTDFYEHITLQWNGSKWKKKKY